MEKIKILVVADDKCNAETYRTDPEYTEITERLNGIADVEFIQDTTMQPSPPAYADRIDAEGPEWVTPQKELMDRIGDVDILLVHWIGVNKKIIDAGNNLKFIGLMRSGFENINKEYAESKGIVVKNCPGRLSDSVADLTLALIIDETRGLFRCNLHEGCKYPGKDKYFDTSSRPIRMLSIGLVGFGAVAREVAKRLKACGGNIMAYDPFLPDEVFEKCGVLRVSLEELLKKSDVVSLHVRYSEKTDSLIGMKELKLMKPTAVLVNTARAKLIVEEDLIEALNKKIIRGAAMDVTWEEPAPLEHELYHMDNVIVLPHLGGKFSGMMKLSYGMIMDEVLDFIKMEKV